MLIEVPAVDREQIENWMRESSERIAPPGGDELMRTRSAAGAGSSGFDFKKVRGALQRARTKTSVRTVKPLRRLRTDQLAVNESLTDALGALLNVNKAMAAELAMLAAEVAELRAEAAARAAEANGRTRRDQRGT